MSWDAYGICVFLESGVGCLWVAHKGNCDSEDDSVHVSVSVDSDGNPLHLTDGAEDDVENDINPSCGDDPDCNL